MSGPARRAASAAICLAASLVAAAPLAAQGGASGTIADSATGIPIEGVLVRALDASGRPAAAANTNAAGVYHLAALPAGAWRITAARIGYAPAERTGVQVLDGHVALADFRLAARPVPASEIIVTAQRQPQLVLDAPAATSIVPREQVEQQVAATPIDYLTGVTGIDVASKGLAQRTYSTRGSRGVSSGSLLTLTDGRNVTLPSIGFNIPYLMPMGAADVDRIEVVRGPAGAVYGPNTERGVVQVLTRSPFDAAGTTLNVAAGGRDLLQAELRQAGVISERFGYKLTGEYLGGTDWVYVDTTGAALRDAAAAGGNPDSLLINARDPDMERWGLGATLSWRPQPGAEIQTGLGYAQAAAAVDLEPTLGPIQLKGWSFGNAFAEYASGRVVGRFSYTWNDAGNSYSLWFGNPIVDFSTMSVAQIKLTSAIGQRGSLQYGGDFHYTNPDTRGTISGANEDDDQVAEVGGFALADLPLGNQVRLSAALRADYHDRIGTVGVAPRVGIVYQPTPTQAFRVTYGRGYTTPSPPDFFADIQVASSLGGLPYPVRISGIPPGGYQFARSCGGLCMRSPFDADPWALQPIDATAYWSTATTILAAQGGPDLSGVPAPTAAEVASVLRALDLVSEGFDPTPIDPATVQDYPTEGRETTDAFEVGYKASLGSRWNVAVDAAYSVTRDFFGASAIGTPNVFLDEATLAAYLTPYLGGDPALAAQVAAGMTQIPLGVITPVNAASPNTLLNIRHQGGSFSRVNVDLEVSYLVVEGLEVSGTYSWVNRDSIGSAGGSDMAVLSAPQNKGALAVSYRRPGSRWGAWAQGVAVETYPVKSGVFTGTIPSYAVLNLGATVLLPGRSGLSLALTANNIFDDVHQEYVGAPAIGRLLVMRLQAAF